MERGDDAKGPRSATGPSCPPGRQWTLREQGWPRPFCPLRLGPAGFPATWMEDPNLAMGPRTTTGPSPGAATHPRDIKQGALPPSPPRAGTPCAPGCNLSMRCVPCLRASRFSLPVPTVLILPPPPPHPHRIPDFPIPPPPGVSVRHSTCTSQARRPSPNTRARERSGRRPTSLATPPP